MATQTRYPTGDGSVNWDLIYPASPTTHYDKVYEETPDDDSSYIQDHTAGATAELFNFSAFSVPTGSTINNVTVYSRGKLAGSAPQYAERILIGGTGYNGTTHIPTSSYDNYSSVWTTNPKTGLAWTVDDVNGVGANALQAFGVTEITTDTSRPRVTQVYCVVNYTPPPVAKETVYLFDLRNLIAKETIYPFDLYILATKETVYLFDLRNLIAKETVYPFDLYVLAAKETVYPFDLRNLAPPKETVYLFDIYNLAAKETAYLFDLWNLVSRETIYLLDIEGLFPGKETIYLFDLKNLISKETVYPFDLRNLAPPKETVYILDIYNLAPPKETIYVFDLINLAGKETAYLFDLWNLASKETAYLFDIWNLRRKRFTLLDTLELRTTAVYRNPRDISLLKIVYGDLSNSKIPCTPVSKDGLIWHASDRPMQSITKVFAGDQEKTSGYSAFPAYQDETGQSIACVVFNSPQFDKPISISGKGTMKLDTGELIESPADFIKDVCLNVQGYDTDSIDFAEIVRLYADCLKEEIKVAFVLSNIIIIKQLFDELAQNIHAHWMISDGKSVMRLRWL